MIHYAALCGERGFFPEIELGVFSFTPGLARCLSTNNSFRFGGFSFD